MKLKRIDQILGGRNCHYILLNHFKLTEGQVGSDLQTFTLNFLNSKCFVSTYIADIKKVKGVSEFLPFPFNPKQLREEDFEVIAEPLTKQLKLHFAKMENDFRSNNKEIEWFNSSLNLLDEYMGTLDVKNYFSLISIDNFDNKSRKVADLLQKIGYVFDYFYFGIIPLKAEDEILTFELAYE